MSDIVIVALIGLVSGALTAIIGAVSEWLRDRQRLALERARAQQEGVDVSTLDTGRIDPWKWAFIGLVAALLFTAALIVAVRVIVAREPAALPANAVLHFDCETLAGWETVDAFEQGWQYIGALAGAAHLAGQELSGGSHCAYDLPLSAGRWRDYTLTYAQQVQADVITARFLLDDPDHRVQNSAIGLVALDGSQRLAQSILAVPAGGWTEVVLDLRQFRDPSGQPLDRRYITLQITLSLYGEPGINADAHATIGLDDLFLLRDSGQTAQPDPVAYASSGLSAFITPQTIAADTGDFAWIGDNNEETFTQVRQPEIIYDTVGGVTGPLLRYPVTLRSFWDESRTYQFSPQVAQLARQLREPERARLRAILTSIYISADADARVHVIPFLIFKDGTDAQGFGQIILTNRWQTVVWSQIVNVNLFRSDFSTQLEALRATAAPSGVDQVYLAGKVQTDLVEQYGLRFIVESDLEPGQEYTLDATITLGSATFLP